MGLLDTLLSVFGLADSSSDGDRRDATVSVERETRSGAATADETGDDAAAAEADTAASTGSPVDGVDGSDGAVDPAGAAGSTAGTPEAGPDASAGETTSEHGAADAESVKVIKGIGPAYAERLSNEDVESVADLAAADAAELAAAIDLSEKRVGGWIERARDR